MDTAEGYLDRVWKDAKTWRSVRLGPVTLHLRLGRSHSRRSRFALTLASDAQVPTMKLSGSIAEERSIRY